jgi:hypothetical protein
MPGGPTTGLMGDMKPDDAGVKAAHGPQNGLNAGEPKRGCASSCISG